MTAPIQEPNLYRHASGLQWGQNQLFRRPAQPTDGGGIPWVRLKQLDIGQTWTDDEAKSVVFDDICFSTSPDGTEYFTIADLLPGDNNIVEPHIAGLYQMTFRAYLDVTPTPFPADGFEIAFIGVDWDQWDNYGIYVQGSAKNNTGGGFLEVTFRAQENDFSSAQWQMETTIRTFADPMKLQDNGGGTYWEVRYLGSADTPLGLDNQNFECTS